jgi:hypothetical protein
LYSPSRALGRTPISIANVSGPPSAGAPVTSRRGWPTNAIPASSSAVRHQRFRPSCTARSTTVSRPRRCITIGGGTLPLRKPATRRLRPSWRAARSRARCTSSGATSATTRTRLSGSSVTVVLMEAPIA